jgi:hypothetical protein
MVAPKEVLRLAISKGNAAIATDARVVAKDKV